MSETRRGALQSSLSLFEDAHRHDVEIVDAPTERLYTLARFFQLSHQIVFVARHDERFAGNQIAVLAQAHTRDCLTQSNFSISFCTLSFIGSFSLLSTFDGRLFIS